MSEEWAGRMVGGVLFMVVVVVVVVVVHQVYSVLLGIGVSIEDSDGLQHVPIIQLYLLP